MRRITACGVWASCLGLTLGCGGSADDRQKEHAPDDVDIKISETAPLVETGCLTASGDRFVLTALESGGRAAETRMYQLVGHEDDLRNHVGRQVRVTGEAEPAQIAGVKELSQSTPTGTAGTDGTQPQVRTEAETRLETRRMRVTAVTATGDDCPEARR